MKVAELLPAKKLVSAKRTKVAISVTSAGHFWRARMSLTTKDFEFLFGNQSAAPRSEIYGSGPEGLIVQVHTHSGVKVTMTSKSTVACNFSCRDLAITENRVGSTNIEAVLVEYEDKTRYLLTAPLPDQFLATAVRKRREIEHTPPLKAALVGFEAAGGDLPETMRLVPPVHVDSPVKPEEKSATTVAPPAEPVPPAENQPRPLVVAGTATGAENDQPRSLNDLKDLLAMLTDQVEELKKTGTNVVLRVEDGVVKASVPVTVYQDL